MRISCIVIALMLLAACNPGGAPPGVVSYLSGQLVLADSLQGMRVEAFSLLVFNETPTGVDTLGIGQVDATGAFAFNVTAADRGIYPLVLLYENKPLRVDELVVADGDSATVRYPFPVTGRVLRVRSRENDAWMAYRNAKALYNSALQDAVGQDGALSLIQMGTLQASNILWSLRDGYPGTVAEELGVAESVVLLDGWDDSLLVARAGMVDPSNAGFVTVAQAARRGQARLEGQGASIRLLEAFRDKTADMEDQAAIQAEIVTARLDSMQADAAIGAARLLREQYPKSAWAGWAERAEYEAASLMPGRPSPVFRVTTTQGRTLTLDSLRGRYVVLEFFAPGSDAFRQQLDGRLALEQALESYPVSFVSVSLDTDSLMTRAFFSQVPFQGFKVEDARGDESPLAKQFNVHALPTRYLIGPEGTLLAKYVGPLVPQLTLDLLTLLRIAKPAS